MAKPEVAVVSVKVMELHQSAQAEKEELDALYGRWEELSMELSE